MTVASADTNYAAIFDGGNVGIGDTTPASLFTVGSGDLFQINASGQVTSGTWNGTDVAAQYGGSGINTSASTVVPTISSGTWSVSSSLAVALGGTGTTTAFTTGSIVFAGASGVYTQDNSNFFWDDTTNRLGIGTASPSSPLDIFGTSNALRLSYDISNYGTVSSNSAGSLVLSSSNTTEAQFILGGGASTDSSIAFDGASQDYYAGLDHTTGSYMIGSGFVVGTSPYVTITSTGNVGIGDTTPDAKFDFDFASTNATAGTERGSYFTVSDTGVVTTGTDSLFGNLTFAQRTGVT